MARKTPKGELRRLEDAKYRGRSATYRYIRVNFSRFIEIGVGTSDGPSWQEFAALLAREGQKNTQGGPVSWDSARRIFERVRKDVQAKALTLRTGISPRARHPAQLPQTWQPIPIRGTQAPLARPPEPRQDDNGRTLTAEQKVAIIRQEFAERSGR